ncbi:MAG: peptidoglycan-N-acetylglucosamine deacetylase [Propionibacteriaceae bacterium]|nr:putative hydrolase [Propionibacteriaceae bacterium]MDX6322454.1 peptidoglycan-N-acetylglucosamine deacetylase [Propionibacteriaceae bacterium]
MLELPRLEHKKSEALNTAWARYGRDADIVICLDADTVMPPNAVKDWEQELIGDADRLENEQVWLDTTDPGTTQVKPRGALPLGGSSSKFTMLGTDFLTRLQRAEFSRWTDTALRRGWTSVSFCRCSS